MIILVKTSNYKSLKRNVPHRKDVSSAQSLLSSLRAKLTAGCSH